MRRVFPMACTSLPMSALFDMYPAAPQDFARSHSSRRGIPARRRTRALGWYRLSRAIVSKPSIPGMRTSESIMSGHPFERTYATADSPSAQV